MKIEKVFVSQSDYGTCLRWEEESFRYHIWNHTPGTVFKNPPYGVESRQPRYFRTRHLDATKKANAAMVAEAQRIAKEQGLYESATEAKRQEKAEEEAKQKAAIVRHNKTKAAEEMYTALELVLKDGCHCRNTEDKDWHGDHCLIPLIRAAIAKADGKSTAPVA